MADISAFEFTRNSFLALAIFTIFASTYPTQVAGMTGLESEDLKKLDAFQLESDNYVLEDTIQRDPSFCPHYSIPESQRESISIVNGTIVPDSEGAWFILELDRNVSGIYVDANEQPLFFTPWITWEDSDSLLLRDSGTVSGEDYFLDADALISEDLNRYFNFTFRNLDAEIYGFESECERKIRTGQSSAGVYSNLVNFPLVSAISDFVGYIVTFFELISSFFSSLFGLFSVSGNVVSTTILKLWAGSTLVMLLFTISDKVIDLIGSIGSLIPFT